MNKNNNKENNFVKYLKSINYLRNLMVALGILIFLLVIDISLKTYVFAEAKNHGNINFYKNGHWLDSELKPLKSIPSSSIHENKLFGFRALAHYSTTFLDAINVKISKEANLTISFFIILILITSIIFTKKIGYIIGISFILAGTVGNSSDVATIGYVRDILYTPWRDEGTFNLSDLNTFAGVGIIFISIIVYFFPSKKDRNNNKELKSQLKRSMS
ncbi:MAG: signal peptidase II [Mollicutes bacterium PWAP]|nr:signal peptidase II [Mollicutes bacterium PWAP]